MTEETKQGGVIVQRARPNKVAIVAMGTSRDDYIKEATKKMGKWQVADEIWAINAMAGVIQYDLAFIMDPHDEMPPQYEEIYLSAKNPVFTSKTDPKYPALVRYPIEEVINKSGGMPYINNSVAYAVAFAVYLGVPEIHLYGCDFCYPNVYSAESGRACVEYWATIAMAKGLKVHIGETSTLFDIGLGMPLYAFKDIIFKREDDGHYIGAPKEVLEKAKKAKGRAKRASKKQSELPNP